MNEFSFAFRIEDKFKIENGQYVKVNTLKSDYKEPAYKELPFIRNRFSFPNHYQGISSI